MCPADKWRLEKLLRVSTCQTYMTKRRTEQDKNICGLFDAPRLTGVNQSINQSSILSLGPCVGDAAQTIHFVFLTHSYGLPDLPLVPSQLLSFALLHIHIAYLLVDEGSARSPQMHGRHLDQEKPMGVAYRTNQVQHHHGGEHRVCRTGTDGWRPLEILQQNHQHYWLS